mmetsp:Transcript_21004/g.34333  ORF Transcript_21004/g.34333 Transcript_21004/m.34333 type:complete len:108 (+) Transcript_21004:1030-1353(+)
MSAENVESIANNPLHNSSDPSSVFNGRASPGGTNYYHPLQRFRQGQVEVGTADDGHLLEDGTTHSQLSPGHGFNPLSREYFDQTREDDWSNSRSHSRSPSRSSPSSR